MDTTLTDTNQPGSKNAGIRGKSLGLPALYGLVLLGLSLTYLVLKPFFVALTWAVIFAILFRGMQTTLAQRMGPKRAAALTTLVVTLLIVTPAVFVISTLAREAPQVAGQLKESSQTAPDQFARIWSAVRSRSPIPMAEDPGEFLKKASQRAVAFLSSRASAFLNDSLAALGTLGSMLFALFFMLRDGDRMRRMVQDRLPFPEHESERLINQVRDLVTASVGAALIVAVVQGVIGGVVFWLLHMPAPAFWGVVMGICSLLPLFGATLVWVPAGVGLLLSGDTTRGVLMLLAGTFGISMADNILRPMLLTGKTSVSGMVIFFGLLGGAAAFGLVGLVIGPIILVITPEILDTLRNRNADDEPARPDHPPQRSRAGQELVAS